MLNKRITQLAIAYAELFIAAFVLMLIAICLSYEGLVFGYKIDFFRQPFTDWPGFVDEWITMSFFSMVSLMMVIHAFRLIVLEKY